MFSDALRPLTLVAADALEADAAVAGSRHVVAGGVVHALAQLLAAVAEGPGWTLWSGGRGGETTTVSDKRLRRNVDVKRRK